MRTICLYLLALSVWPWGGGRHWNFEGTRPLEGSDGSLLTWSSAKRQVEIVEGVIGNGLRTDGYSTFLSYILEKPVGSIGGYFALESFPTDTSCFFSFEKEKEGIGLGVAVDKFGELMLVSGPRGRCIYGPTGVHLSRYKWMHIALSLHDEVISVFLDGFEIYRGFYMPLPDEGDYKIVFGKGYDSHPIIGRFESCINGIMDELSVGEPLPSKEEIAQRIAISPRLAIPPTRFADDYSRPRYHLIPAANWTNETHGLLYYKGKYHIFNQKNASNILLRQINWGHFSSLDLIHWTEEKVALSPEPDYDSLGIWSGHAVINDYGVPQIFYTAGKKSNGIATAFPADDDLIEWHKYEANPVVDIKPDEYERTDMRDQYVWKDGDTWYMINGFGITGHYPHGALLLYKSKDLLHWEYVHLFHEGNPDLDKTGIFWEMPALLRFGNKYVLSINRVPTKKIPARTQYWVGRIENETFIPDHAIPRNLEVINGLLSPSFCLLPDGRTVSIAIIPDKQMETYQRGWAHLFSIPREISLQDGKIIQRPLRELESLRGEGFKLEEQPLKGRLSLPDMGHQYELLIRFRPGNARKFGVVLHKNPDGSEFTKLYFDCRKGNLVFKKKKIGNKRPWFSPRCDKDSYTLSGDEVLLHLYVDGSVLEGFINEQDAFTNRLYPSKSNSTLVELFSDGTTTMVQAGIWKMSEAITGQNF